MRFTTIWSLPGLPLRERITRTLDLWAMLVYDILPKRVVYWIAIRAIGKATMTSQNVPATSLDNVLQNLGHIRRGEPLEQFVWHESMRYPLKDHEVHINVNPADLTSEDLARKAEREMRRYHGGHIQ